MAKKKYPYEDVIDFTNGGGPLDSALTQLQNDLNKLYSMVDECQELYHGETGKTIEKKYKSILEYNIGYSRGYGQAGNGVWNSVVKIAELNDFMNANARRDQEADEFSRWH